MNSVNFNDAHKLLKEGDILLFRGTGVFSYLIQKASKGRYSHVGVVSGHGSNGSTIWECIEFREWKGGRTVNLEQYVSQNPGIIDVYRPISSHKMLKDGFEQEISFNGKKITNTMRKMTGLPYGWRRIWYMAQLNLPFLRLLFPVSSIIDDSDDELIYPVCSTAVAYCFDKEGYDLVHNRTNNYVEPSDVGRSPLLNYVFTLI